MITHLNFTIPSSMPRSRVVFFHGYGSNGLDLLSIGHIWKTHLPNTEFYGPNAPIHLSYGEDRFGWYDLSSFGTKELNDGVNQIFNSLDTYLKTLTPILPTV